MGARTTNGLQVLLSLAVVPVTQAEGALVRGHDYNSLQVLLALAAVPVAQAGLWRGVS